MFVFLIKKFGLPNSTKINCLAWSSKQGWIGMGGDDGMLKVVKLEMSKDGKGKGAPAPTNFSVSQTLEGHSGSVQVITWNDQHLKITTSDQSGLIIVWILYKGSWHEDMIHRRNKSIVKGMAWDSEGEKICIAFEDGGVMVGCVDGKRIWGKDLPGVKLSGVQWSPDGTLLVFALKNGEVHVYDNQGLFAMKVNIQCLPSVVAAGMPISGMVWYDGKNGYIEPDCPCLAICYQSGHIQIMRSHEDDYPVIVDTGVTIVCCSWNHNGSILAIAGSTVLPGQTVECNVVQFYSPFGELVCCLKVPGSSISCCVWEGSSLHIAIAVDSLMYIAMVRPSYKWAYFADTLVYAYNNPSRPGTQITFWNTVNNEIYSKTVPFLYGVVAYKDHCVLAIRSNDNNGKFGLLLCNSIATTVDTKYMDLEPLWITLNSSHVVAASKDHFLIWHFITPKSHSTFGLAGIRHKRDRLYHIDDTPSGVAEVIHDLDRNYQPPTSMQATGDPICCLAATDKILVIGRESGSVQRYTLPQVALVNRYTLNSKPLKLSINCDSTRVAVIDATGIFTLLDLDGSLEDAKMERLDVWSVVWAADNPHLFAIMEKTRMYIIRGTEPEEPIMQSGYICSFQDLELRAVLLDDIMASPDSPSVEQHILDLEVKSLRDTRALLEKVGMKEATTFIEENQHPRLWRLLAESALKTLDLATAEAAFVRCSDYPGIRLVKKLGSMTNEQLKKAVVAAHFGNYDEAEQLYLDADRRDLAIGLREKLGDWFKLVQLLKMGTGAADSQFQSTWNAIGDIFSENNEWESAKEYYEKARNTERLVECYRVLEDYEGLEKCVSLLPEKHPTLTAIADIFISVGMCSEAVMALVKCGHVKRAVDACVYLNQWGQAVELAEAHAMLPRISQLLDKYASSLLEKERQLEVVELFRKSYRFLDAAKLLYQIAKEEGKKKSRPSRIKKLYVLAALLLEDHLKMVERSRFDKSSSIIMDSLDDLSDLDMKTIDNAWRGAEAYHFLMLTQRQLYNHQYESSMLTSLHLRMYDDILSEKEIYSLIGLSSCKCKAFGTASKAFIKLESIPTLDEAEKEELTDLAIKIFTYQLPRDLKTNYVSCSSCNVPIPLWSGVCPGCETRYPPGIVTGRTLTDLTTAWTCKVCKHSAPYNDISTVAFCPLCHSPTSI